MDGHFVPNLTFGPEDDQGDPAADRAAARRPPDDQRARSLYVDEFLDAGCDSITFHVEVDEPQIAPTLRRIREAGRAAGPAVKPDTPLSALEPYRDLLDIVLVMTVEPGFGGQSFMTDVAAAKIRPPATWLDPAARARSRSTAAAGRDGRGHRARRDRRHRGRLGAVPGRGHGGRGGAHPLDRRRAARRRRSRRAGGEATAARPAPAGPAAPRSA